MARHRTAARYNLPSGPAPIVQLPDLSKTNAVNARLAQFPLENEAKQAQLARAQSAEARSRYQLQKEIETDRQKTAFYNGLQELEQTLNARSIPIGTKEHAEAFAAYAHAFPLARSSADVDKTLQLHAKVNDDQAALSQRIQTQLGAFKETGLVPEGGSVTQSGAVDVRFKAPQQDAESKLGKLYGFTPQQFLNPYKVEAGNFNDKGQFVNDDNGSAFRVTAGANKEGTGALVKIMPKAEFESFKTALMPKESQADVVAAPAAAATPIPSATATSTPDPRTELAQRALNDPNATDAHRAKARQILGIQEDNASE